MKTQKSLVLLLTICVLTLLSVNVIAQESNATLPETLDWLKGKANLIEGVGLPPSEKASDRNRPVEYFYDIDLQLDTSSQCTLTWRESDVPAARAKAKNNRSTPDRPSLVPPPNIPLDISVSLVSLDPEKVEIISTQKLGGMFSSNVNMWAVKLSATDGQQRMIWNGTESRVERSSLFLVFQDEQMAERIARAFRHGIKLCGGKKSKAVKEPF